MRAQSQVGGTRSPARGPVADAPQRGQRGRGRPTKRQVILAAARDVFLRKGYAEGAVDAIAAAAGVSKQTIYSNFGGKENLFRAVIHEAQRAVTAEPDAGGLEQRLATSDNLERDLRAIGRRLVAGALREDVAALRRLVLAEWNRHPELLAAWELPRPGVERALGRAFARQVERGVLDITDLAVAVRQLILVVVTPALMRSLDGRRPLSDAEVAEIVDSGVEMWLRCYQTRS